MPEYEIEKELEWRKKKEGGGRERETIVKTSFVIANCNVVDLRD